MKTRENQPLVKQPQMLDMCEIIDSVLYDRVQFPKGEIPAEVSLFSTPLGQFCPYTGKQRTLADTNMVMGHMLPPPKSFVIERIGWLVAPTEPKLRVPDGFWELCLDDKRFAYGPLRLDAGWGSVYQPGDKAFIEKDSAHPWLGQGVELTEDALDYMRRLENSLCIFALAYLEVRLRFVDRVIKEDLDCWCVLVGKETRSIQ